MNFQNKKFYLAGLAIIFFALFFVANASPALAAGCDKNSVNLSSLFSFLNPLTSLAEKVVKNFGYQVSLAADPDPDFCGSDSVSCSEGMPTATIDWAEASGQSFYDVVVYTGDWTFCANGGATCLFSGTKVVRYGADSCGYVYGNFTDTDAVSCVGDVFNPGPFGAHDPCPYISKHCDYASGVAYRIPLNTNTRVISHTFSSGLQQNTLYNWLVEAYAWGGYGYYPSRYRGYSNQPYGSFTTPSCIDCLLSASDDITINKPASGTASGSNTITATLTSGPTANVNFTVSGLPTGASASFSPSTCSPTCSTTLTITIDTFVAVRTYPITVGGACAPTSFNLIILPTPPTVTLTANGIRPQIKIASGWPVNLNWTSTNANSCTGSLSSIPDGELNGASQWNNATLPTNDSSPNYTYTLTASPQNERIYTFSINCSGPGGSAQDSLMVDVIEPILTLTSVSQKCRWIDLAWSWNDNFFNDKYSYRVFRRTGNEPDFSLKETVNIMNYRDEDIFVSGQTYYYQIEAQPIITELPSISSNILQTVPCPPLPKWEEIRPR